MPKHHRALAAGIALFAGIGLSIPTAAQATTSAATISTEATAATEQAAAAHYKCARGYVCAYSKVLGTGKRQAWAKRSSNVGKSKVLSAYNRTGKNVRLYSQKNYKGKCKNFSNGDKRSARTGHLHIKSLIVGGTC